MSGEIQHTDVESDEIAEHAAEVAAPEIIATSLGEYARIWLTLVRSGESGALPVVLGLGAIVAYFQVRTSLFLSAGNLVNLMSQAAWIVTLGMAEVFVLLLGEIDLSIGYSSAMGAVITLWLVSPQNHLPWAIAALAGLAVPALYSAIQAVLITRLRVPSFVVTLGGLLMGEGLLLFLMNTAAPRSGGTISLPNTNVLYYIQNNNISPVADWIIMLAAVAVSGGGFWVRDSRRRATNLAAPPVSVTILKIGVIAVAGVLVVVIGNANRGVTTVLRGLPWVVLLVVVLLVAWSTLLGRTRFGRYVYAIGGNAEAARRAGISLNRIRIMAFALCGLTAGVMGIIYASQQGGMSTNVNGGQNVLFAVAAAVIGGTSLFGGRGRMLGALLGGLIVAVIYNGLSLLGLGDAAQYMWTAAVLLAAITVDAIARRNPGQ